MKLPRQFTLNHRADFQEIRTKGHSFSGKYLVLAALKKPEIQGFRYALITTKKAGKAHERNRIRRLIRMALVKEGHRIAQPCHLIFIARWRAKDATQAQIQQDFLSLCRRLSLLEEEGKNTTHEAKS